MKKLNLFEKIKQLKPLARLAKKKRLKIVSERLDVTTDTIQITKDLSRENYEQLYANKLDSLKKMDKFRETYNLPTLNDEEKENLSRGMISKDQNP